MKILFVVNTWEGRGAEQQLIDLRQCFPENILSDVFVFTESITRYSYFIIAKSRVKGTIICPFLKSRVGKSLLLFYYLLKNRYDVVITEGLGAALFFGRLYGVICGVPLIYSTLHTLHNLNRNDKRYFEPANVVLNRILPHIWSKQRFKFLAVCVALRDKVRDLVPGYPAETFWNAIPSDFEKEVMHHLNSPKKVIGEKIISRPCLIQVGSLDKNKNHIFTLQCMNKLREKIPNVCYLIIGDGPLRTEIAEYIKREGLEDHVFLIGQTSRMECLYLISKANVLVLTSFSEAFPLVLLEAQLFGIPVVGFDVGGVSDIIIDGDNGFLTSVNVENEFQERVIAILSDPHMAKEMGLRGKKRLYQKFTMEHKSEILVRMINSDLTRLLELR